MYFNVFLRFVCLVLDFFLLFITRLKIRFVFEFLFFLKISFFVFVPPKKLGVAVISDNSFVFRKNLFQSLFVSKKREWMLIYVILIWKIQFLLKTVIFLTTINRVLGLFINFPNWRLIQKERFCDYKILKSDLGLVFK